MLWYLVSLTSFVSSHLACQPDRRSSQLALLLAGVIAAPSFIPLFMLNNTPPQSRRGGGGADEGRGCLHRPAHSIIPHLQAPSWSLALTRVNILLRTPFFFLMLIYIFTGLGAGLFIPYFNIYFVQHLKASPSLFGLIDGGANAITALLTLVPPFLANRLCRINTIPLTPLSAIPPSFTTALP